MTSVRKRAPLPGKQKLLVVEEPSPRATEEKKRKSSTSEAEIQKLLLALQSGPVLSRSQREQICRHLSTLPGGESTFGALKKRGKGRPRKHSKFHPVRVRALALAVEYRMRLAAAGWGAGKDAARIAKQWAEEQFPGVILLESEIAKSAQKYPKAVKPRSLEFFKSMVRGESQMPEGRHQSFFDFEAQVLESIADENFRESLLSRLQSDARSAGLQSARAGAKGIAQTLIAAFEARFHSQSEAKAADEISSELLQTLHETFLVELAPRLEQALGELLNARVK